MILTLCVLALTVTTGDIVLPAECALEDGRYEIYQAMFEAGVPYELWGDFAAVAACESNFNNGSLGDGGLAKGLYQIHFDFWIGWAHGAGLLLDVSPGDWQDPVANTRLAYAIGEHYDVAAGRDRFAQWSVKPTWTSCQARVPPIEGIRFIVVVSPDEPAREEVVPVFPDLLRESPIGDGLSMPI
jgi:hypothetical protein